MMCGTQPPRRRVGTLEFVGGDFARAAWGCEWGEPPLKRGRSPGRWTCLRTPLMHCALPPSEPPDGERPRCLRLAAVGRARPHGGWRSSVIARLQGFSSCSPVAVPRRRSPKMMIVGLVVGRSKPGYGLCPALSFKDVHHPRCGGGRAEPGFYLPHGPASRLFLQHSGERALTGLAEGANFDKAGPVGCKRRQLQRAWLAGSAGFVAASDAASCRLVRAWLSVHRTGDCCAVRTGGPSKMSYAAWAAFVFLDCLVLTPARRLRVKVGACPSART
jgi:hypothetical protein